MKQFILEDYQSLCASVADQVFMQLSSKPDSVLVFPTGNTPLGLFEKLIEGARLTKVDFSKAHFVVLDEYADLPLGDPRSLTGWLKQELLDPLSVSSDHIHGFEQGVEAIERVIAKLGGIDLAILGLGPNGHLAFNEPGSAFDSNARRITLTPESIKSNASYWGSEDKVPREGLTLGLGTIAKARNVILMVSGAAKISILAQTLHGKVTPANPASSLRMLPQSLLFADKAAIS